MPADIYSFFPKAVFISKLLIILTRYICIKWATWQFKTTNFDLP